MSTTQNMATLEFVVAIAETVGAVEGQPPLDMDTPLFECVDLDMIYCLLESMQTGDSTVGSIRFETNETTVIVDIDGTVIARHDGTVEHGTFEFHSADARTTETREHDS